MFHCFSDIWSENDGRLGVRLCEEKNEEEESNEIQTECCACEEAKYEVMFQVRDESFVEQTKH